MPIEVKGLRELNKAFALLDKNTAREIRAGLRTAAEPVRSGAELRAASEITNIGPTWSRMKVGVTTRVVYVAPRARGTRIRQRKRKNLAGLLMDRAMLPALEANVGRVENAAGRVLDDLGHQWEHVG